MESQDETKEETEERPIPAHWPFRGSWYTTAREWWLWNVRQEGTGHGV